MLWRALLEGVRRSSSEAFKDLAEHPDNFKLIAWNYLYYQSRIDDSDQLPWLEALIKKQEPTKLDIREAKAWKRTLDKVLYSAIDQLPALVQVLPRAARQTAEELDRYFENIDQIGSQVREQLKQELRPLLADNKKVILFGHSLGSVIAYDTLWALSHLEHLPGKIDLFLTIGSPLGMNYVQDRTLGNQYKGKNRYPENIRNWVNISAVGDVTSLDRSFTDDYKEMLEFELTESITDYSKDIYNYFRNQDGLNVHRSYGYLVNPVVGEVIANWWQHHHVK